MKAVRWYRPTRVLVLDGHEKTYGVLIGGLKVNLVLELQHGIELRINKKIMGHKTIAKP